MQSILMLVRQLNEGRHEVENEYTRAVVRDGNARAIALVEEVFELRPIFEWRGLGTLPDSALRLRDEVRRVGRGAEVGHPLRAGPGPQGVRVRGDPPWAEEADRLQDLRHGLHPESPVGSCMVSPGGVVRGLLRVRAPARETPQPQAKVEG